MSNCSILNKFTKDINGVSLVKDGPINEYIYSITTPKILWILKEANDEDGGGWNIVETLNKNCEVGQLESSFDPTFRNIIHTSYGILEKKLWKDFPSYYNDLNVLKSLQKIAFINIKKYPGSSVANDSVLNEHYQRDKKLVLEQIDLLKPDIIICGNTFKFIREDLNVNDKNYKFEYEEPNCGIYSNDKHLVFDAYHPNYRKGDEQYCNSIIVKSINWLNSK